MSEEKKNPPKSTKKSLLEKIDKELSTSHFLLSQLILLIICLIFLGGLYLFLNIDFRENIVDKYLPVTQKKISFNIEVSSPDNDTVVFENVVEVLGKTAPRANILISNLNLAGESIETLAMEANANGNFSQNINLQPGLNRVVIAAYDIDGDKKEEQINIYYSEEKI